ncbi:MAG: GspJ family type II secretion system protein [Verrucomicrobiota bacterium]|nr:GspJ family type II secretion system protein [Verrucomicrobiota bacterium]
MAFTLIEMILAIGVAALVLAAINAVFFAALRLRDATQAAVDGAAPVEQALSVMGRDLACAVPPKPGGVLSGDFRAGAIRSAGVSGPAAIELYTASGRLSASEPWGDIQRVTYELKPPRNRNEAGMELVRSVARNLLTAATPTVENQRMLSGVAGIQFTCFDGAQWLGTWDTTDSTAGDTNLPLAVRVTIQMAGGDNASAPVELLVPIDAQSRSNATDVVVRD